MVSSLLNQLDAQKVIINIKLHINITCVAYSFTDIHPKMCLSIMIEIHFWFQHLKTFLNVSSFFLRQTCPTSDHFFFSAVQMFAHQKLAVFGHCFEILCQRAAQILVTHKPALRFCATPRNISSVHQHLQLEMARNFELELAKATFQVDTLLCRRDIGESFQPEGSTVGSKHPLGLFWLCWSDRKWHNVLLNHIVLSGVCF